VDAQASRSAACSDRELAATNLVPSQPRDGAEAIGTGRRPGTHARGMRGRCLGAQERVRGRPLDYQLRAAIDAVARLPPTSGSVLRFVAGLLGDSLHVHDRTALRAEADRRIATTVVHVDAKRGPGAGSETHDGYFATGLAAGREWSAMRKVARLTLTSALQRGHFGLIVLPAAPSRYESGASQCGHGRNVAYTVYLPASGSEEGRRHVRRLNERAWEPYASVSVELREGYTSALSECNLAEHATSKPRTRARTGTSRCAEARTTGRVGERRTPCHNPSRPFRLRCRGGKSFRL